MVGVLRFVAVEVAGGGDGSMRLFKFVGSNRKCCKEVRMKWRRKLSREVTLFQ